MKNKKTHKLIINIKNRKAKFEYHLNKFYVAGIKLKGSEIKSIRKGEANLNDAYCFFKKGELYVKDMFISEYGHSSPQTQHEPKRDRKLLLNKSELYKIEKGINIKGYTIIPTRLFINDKGLAKLEISLAKGKNTVDKKETIKQRDIERDMKRNII